MAAFADKLFRDHNEHCRQYHGQFSISSSSFYSPSHAATVTTYPVLWRDLSNHLAQNPFWLLLCLLSLIAAQPILIPIPHLLFGVGLLALFLSVACPSVHFGSIVCLDANTVLKQVAPSRLCTPSTKVPHCRPYAQYIHASAEAPSAWSSKVGGGRPTSTVVVYEVRGSSTFFFPARWQSLWISAFYHCLPKDVDTCIAGGLHHIPIRFSV
jgi:hypothetical protein